MRRLFALLIAATLAATLSFAQQAPDSGQQANPEKSEKKEKKDKKKDKKEKKGGEDKYDTEAVFSQSVANNVLGDLRDGLEGHSQRLMLSAFDADKMEGYLSFEDQIQALFARYDSFRVHYRIAQSTIEGSKGVVLVDFQMEELPRAGGSPQRREGQIRFEMERGRKGWKIVDFTPRGFFS
jgi:hypothetical protein